MEKKRRVGPMLRRLELLMVYRLQRQDQKLIPPAQMRMLEFISENGGCTQAEVAAKMRVSPASVAQSIKRMEAAGCITRDEAAGNRRANSLSITETGVKAASECRLVFDRLEERMFTGFTDDEREQTLEYMARLIANLESADTGGMNMAELTKLVKS